MILWEENGNIKIENGSLTRIHKVDDALNLSKNTRSIGAHVGHNLPVRKVNFPDGLQTIQDYGFYQSSLLEEINLPYTVTSIGERAFANCKKIKKVLLPESVTHLGPGVFSGCESLEELVFPKGIKKIPYRACASCRNLKRVVIPEGVEEIDWAAFTDCTSLEEIVLPDSVKKLDKQVFMNCKNLKKVRLPISITSLSDQLFQGCEKLNLHLNSNIKELGHSTFENCPRLTTYPSQVVKIGENCFKNCTGLRVIELNQNIESLPDGAFEGCVHLSNITTNRKVLLPIGKRCFRNCKSLPSVPSFVQNYNIQAFENCTSFTKVDPIQHSIPMACFCGCKNIKEISDSNKIQNFESYAFSGCTSLEEIEIGSQAIAPNAFSHCKNLKMATLHPGIKIIGARAFFDCPQLTNVLLPDTIESIKQGAFQYCHSIRSLTIPCSLTHLGEGAFAYMDSLEYIDVPPENKNFQTPDHKILIHPSTQGIILYASGCKDRKYSLLENYTMQIDALKRTINKQISGIMGYAFAGAKNLEELTISACTDNIQSTAFMGCTNLKTLNIHATDLYTASSIRIRNHANYYYPDDTKTPLYLPFETVNFTGDVTRIHPNALQHFYHIKTIHLPSNGSYQIGENAFHDCTEVASVYIPANVKKIEPNAFSENTVLNFENGLQVSKLDNMTSYSEDKNGCFLYILSDGTYHIAQGQKITSIHKNFIDSVCSHSEEINKDPLLFLDFMDDLFEHHLVYKELLNGILMKNISLEGRTLLLKNLKPGDQFFLDVLTESTLLDEEDEFVGLLLKEDHFSKVVDFINLMKKYAIKDPLLYNKPFIAYYPIQELESLLQNNLDDFTQLIQRSHLFEFQNVSKNTFSHILTHSTINPFMQYIKKYNIIDAFLMNPLFISIADSPLAEAFFQAYDANIKRLIKASMILDKPQSGQQNLYDLLFLLKITGALEEDPICKQRASTFITEKMFSSTMPNGEENKARIVGDDIHRVFSSPQLRQEFDPEFTTFFLENYYDLIQCEKKLSGVFQRIHFNFKEIAATCTSNKGEQRRLKVTLQKALDFLNSLKFDGVTEENRDLAKLIGQWFDSNDSWLTALYIYQESLSAPRNIFTKVEHDAEGNVIYDYDPNHDLREEIQENYPYEWLPKQEYENLVLGKYCNCCAHIAGKGQGIMRSSIILDNCQNLVIRNTEGRIIAKATLYINREQGYGVFNTMEASLDYRKSSDLRNMYEALLRGTQAFMQVYNQNHSIPLSIITIGTNRNVILDSLVDEMHPSIPVLPAISYSDYSYNSDLRYNGDCHEKQKIVLRQGGKI